MGQVAGAGTGTGSEAGDTGISKEVIEALKKQYGFDKPVYVVLDLVKKPRSFRFW